VAVRRHGGEEILLMHDRLDTTSAVCLCLAADKGGVGKTSLSLNLAVALAADGPVLAVDLDPKNDLTFAAQVEPIGADVGALLRGEEHVSLEQAIVADALPGPHRVDILPATRGSVRRAEHHLQGVVANHAVLLETLAPVRSFYRWVIIDTPGGMGALTNNGLAAADYVLGVFEPEGFAQRGAETLFSAWLAINGPRTGIANRFLGFVENKAKPEASILGRGIRLLMVELGYPLLDTRVRKLEHISQATAGFQPVLTFAPASDGAEIITTLADEIRHRITAGQALTAEEGRAGLLAAELVEVSP
jgi:chromosome partitioning protein